MSSSLFPSDQLNQSIKSSKQASPSVKKPQCFLALSSSRSLLSPCVLKVHSRYRRILYDDRRKEGKRVQGRIGETKWKRGQKFSVCSTSVTKLRWLKGIDYQLLSSSPAAFEHSRCGLSCWQKRKVVQPGEEKSPSTSSQTFNKHIKSLWILRLSCH